MATATLVALVPALFACSSSSSSKSESDSTDGTDGGSGTVKCATDSSRDPTSPGMSPVAWSALPKSSVGTPTAMSRLSNRSFLRTVGRALPRAPRTLGLLSEP